ncbi:MFS transporter [Silvibacterium sp.]|uniref:MFS transporter n=1 Tax=Silvibacterium sp. TaxID=1964179 RepID=UPI0039E6D889
MTVSIAEAQQEQTIETDIPQRLDRLPWSSWHMRILTALGTSWLLDGLEVTLVGSLAGILTSPHGLSLTDKQVTAAATTYLAGAVFGALLFGWLTDRLGRRKLFLVTVATYSLATLCSAFSWSFFSFALFRFVTGVGIGGEYAAINSAVDELIPGRIRGTVDLIVNGTFWIGGTVGGLVAIYLLGGQHPALGDHGWRYAFGVGGVLGVVIFLLRLSVPESPRWLMLRGREEQARAVVEQIEAAASHGDAGRLPKPEGESLKIAVRDHTPWKAIFGNMLGENRIRSVLGLVLMVAQAFFFNAIFFSYGLVAKTFFQVSDSDIPKRLLPFAIASFLGPVTIGRLFDTVGRKKMIAITYGLAGLLLAGTAIPFATGSLGMRGVGIGFTLIFFIASSAASAAYLTVSEIFPLELRAFAIAVFYALGTLAGGVGAPVLFGALIETHSRLPVALGYGLGAVLMFGAAICEIAFGVEAAGRSLESVSKPLQSR